MQISKINNQPNFKGHIVVDISGLPKEMRDKTVKAFKRNIGDGLLKKEFVCGEKSVPHDCFVGYIKGLYKNETPQIDEIEISTGSNREVPYERLKQKVAQIDIILLQKTKKLMEQLGINGKAKLVCDVNPESESGYFEIKGIEAETKTIDKKDGVIFNNSFRKNPKGQFEHYDSIIPIL